MIDSSDNRLPYAAADAFQQGPFVDPLVEYYGIIVGENKKQEEEIIARLLQQEASMNHKRAPYFVYYHDSGNGAPAAAQHGGDAIHTNVSNTSFSSKNNNDTGGGNLSFLQKAKQKLLDTIEESRGDGAAHQHGNNAHPHTNSGGATDGAFDASPSATALFSAISMVIEEDEDEEKKKVIDAAELQGLVSTWSDDASVRTAMEELFRQLPVAYGNPEKEIKCDKAISRLIEEQRRAKEVLDVAFREELHVYQKKALPAIPMIEDTCDALDSSQGESRYTLRMLKRTRLQAAGKVKLIALHRRRHQRRLLLKTIESVRTWRHKTESVCRNILDKQYAVAALTLGARLKPRNGKYFGYRAVLEGIQAKEMEQAKAAAALAEKMLNGTNASNPTATSSATPLLSASSPAPAVESAPTPQHSPVLANAAVPTSPNAAPENASITSPPSASLPASTLAPLSPAALPTPAVFLTAKASSFTLDGGAEVTAVGDGSEDEDEDDWGSEEEEEEEEELSAETKAERRRQRQLQRRAEKAKNLVDNLSCLEKVLRAYYQNPWDATDSTNEDMSFTDFLSGASSEVRSLRCGMTLLGHYFALRQIAGKIIGVCVRDDVAKLLSADFDRSLLLNTLRGLHALHIRRDDVASFFVELIDPILNDRFRTALCDVVGEGAGGTWVEVAKSLVPSELHPCTISLLSCLADTLRNVMKLSLACNAMVEEHTQNPTAFGTEAEGLTVFEGCKFLSGLTTRVIHKCFGAIVNYGASANLKRGKVADCLHVYRLLDLFVLMCGSAISDKSPAATTGSLRFQWQAIYTDHFRATTLDEVLKVMQSESFAPFPANAGDFAELQVLFEKQDEEEAKEVFTQYLRLAKPLSLAPTLEGHLKLDVAANPFRDSPFTAVAYQPVEALTDRKPFSLFEEGNTIFTFSSFFVCKSMIEAVNNAKGLASAAGDILATVHGLAAVYIDFITTHFIAQSVHEPLDTDPKVPPHIQAYASTVRATSSAIASTCPAMSMCEFPLLTNAMSMQWKAKAAVREGHFAMAERGSTIAALDTVALCHRLCIQALTGLLEATDLSTVADMNEAITGLSKYAVSAGFRKLAKSIASGESIIFAVEKNKWDGGNVALGVQESSYTATILAELDAHTLHIKEAFKGMPRKAASMLIQHCVFNIMLAFVEGIARVKKFSEGGRTQALTDALYLTRVVKERFPSTSPKLAEYVLGYARAVMGQWQDVIALITNHHMLYTQKQLLAFGDREGFMKKREVSNLLESLNHVDRIPLFLIDDL